MEAHALGLEQVEIQRRPVAHDRHNRPLGPDQLGHHRPIGVRVAEVGDRVHLRQAQGRQLGGQGLAVVHHVAGAQPLAPGPALRSRGGGDHHQARPPGQLNRDRTHTSGAADDQQAAARIGALRIQPQPLEQGLPGREPGEGQRRRFSGTEIRGAAAADRLLHQHPLGVAAWPADVPGEPDPIARGEALHRIPDGLHHPGGIPAEQPRWGASPWVRQAGAHLGVHRIHRHRLHPHQQVVVAGHRIGQLHQGKGPWIAAGKAPVGRNRFHGSRQVRLLPSSRSLRTSQRP